MHKPRKAATKHAGAIHQDYKHRITHKNWAAVALFRHSLVMQLWLPRSSFYGYFLDALGTREMKNNSRIGLFCALAAGLVFVAGSSNSHAAGFDCGRAKTDIEKLICSDKELAELDALLANSYKEARLSGRDDPAKIASDERLWLKNIRDKCTTAACLRPAYKERIKVLDGAVASFDCSMANSKTEYMICSDDVLRKGDRSVAWAYRSLKESSGEPNKIIAEQKEWLLEVRDKCTNIQCMSAAFDARKAELDKQREDLVALTRKKIGYTKHDFFSDMALWPNDASRTIVIYATQASANGDADRYPQQDENFILDIYVLDSVTRKILQHAVDSISSDAIEFQGMNIDKTDYGALLGVQAFGINTSHGHRGCAGYESNSMRLYAVRGKTMHVVLPEIAIRSSRGMCQTECESGTTQRDLEFSSRKGKSYPDVIIREKKTETGENPDAQKKACETSVLRHTYTLRFNGTQYVVPQELEY